MDTRVDDQTNGAEKLRREASIIRNRILVETYLFTQLLGVKRPSFDVRIKAETVQPEFRQARKLLLDGKLHVMSGNAFVIGDSLIIDQRALRKVRGRDHHAARPLAVGRPGYVMGCRSGLKCRNGFHGNRRLGQKSE